MPYLKRLKFWRSFRKCVSHLIRTVTKRSYHFFCCLRGNNNVMLMLTPANIFKIGSFFFLLSIAASSFPHPLIKLFEVLSLESLKLEDVPCGKGSAIYSYTLTVRSDALPQLLSIWIILRIQNNTFHQTLCFHPVENKSHFNKISIKQTSFSILTKPHLLQTN